MKNYAKLFILSFFLLTSCNNSNSLPKLSLLQYGLPIDINAPEGAEVEASDLVFMKDVTVKSGDDYFVQIYYTDNTPNTLEKLLTEAKEEVQDTGFFSKFVQEDENGFIYEKKIGDRINYDFRLIKIIGDNEYKFQAGLIGTFTEEQIKKMYNSVK